MIPLHRPSIYSKRTSVAILLCSIALVCGCAATPPALAAHSDQAGSHPVTVADQSNSTRIETDQATGTIRFIIHGQEQARLDDDGLHVRKNADVEAVTLRGDEILPEQPKPTPKND